MRTLALPFLLLGASQPVLAARHDAELAQLNERLAKEGCAPAVRMERCKAPKEEPDEFTCKYYVRTSSGKLKAFSAWYSPDAFIPSLNADCIPLSHSPTTRN